jgi:sterol desaturase/sphingolipid hydroxylase (fatty acid hydroxylase superfamily)
MYFGAFFKTFSISAGVCFIYDLFINKHRIKKENKKEILDNYKKSLGYVTSNIVTAKIYLDSCEYYLEGKERNNYGMLTDIFIWLISTDILFYSLHRLFHTKYLYYFHKIHHQYVNTYGITSIYGHPIDFIFTNLIPISFAPIMLNFDDITITHIIIFSVFFTVVISHGGYSFLPIGHLNHHIYGKFNYGLAITDRAMNTFFKNCLKN